MSKQYTIDSVTPNSITLSSTYGNLTSLFNAPPGYPDVEFDIRLSSHNDGRRKVSSAIFNSGKTTINIFGTLPSLIGDGVVTNTTSYILHGTSWTNSFILHPTQTNYYVNTSLKFTGRNYANWGEDIQQNLLYLLDNFSNTTEPANKVRGQIWFDTNINKLKVYDGTNWLVIDATLSASTKYTHTQTISASTWNVNHNLNTTDLVFSTYIQVGPDLVPIIPNNIVFVDNDNLDVTFSTSYTGKIVLIAD